MSGPSSPVGRTDKLTFPAHPNWTTWDGMAAISSATQARSDKVNKQISEIGDRMIARAKAMSNDPTYLKSFTPTPGVIRVGAGRRPRTCTSGCESVA